MGISFSDLKVLYHLALRPIHGHDHADRMDGFYEGQAEHYDRFRKRLLQGRAELFQSLTVPQQGIWVDLGGGTGANLEWLEDRLSMLRRVYVVDLSTPLLNIARQRIKERGWRNVEVVREDATVFRPVEEKVDVVTFSYSLTMIPEWYAALSNAAAMLKPGGFIGVVDFYVSRKYPRKGLVRHRWPTRTFWPLWFGADNVFLSSDHLPFLQHHFATVTLQEGRARVPFIPWAKVPYYVFLGRSVNSGFSAGF